MRASSALLAASAIGSFAVVLTAGCDERCCRSGADCIDGAVCFEGACVLRCTADDHCAEGVVCVDGRCDAEQAGDESCPWGTTPLPSDDAGEPSR